MTKQLIPTVGEVDMMLSEVGYPNIAFHISNPIINGHQGTAFIRQWRKSPSNMEFHIFNENNLWEWTVDLLKMVIKVYKIWAQLNKQEAKEICFGCWNELMLEAERRGCLEDVC